MGFGCINSLLLAFFYFSEVESTLFTGDHSSGPTEGELDNLLMGPTECYLSLLVAAGSFPVYFSV